MSIHDLFGPPEQAMDPAYVAAARQLQQRSGELALKMRRDLLRFASVACSCQRRYSWKAPAPPQLECIVHGQLAMDPLTGEILR